jgi:hypothetical protein
MNADQIAGMLVLGVPFLLTLIFLIWLYGEKRRDRLRAQRSEELRREVQALHNSALDLKDYLTSKRVFFIDLDRWDPEAAEQIIEIAREIQRSDKK